MHKFQMIQRNVDTTFACLIQLLNESLLNSLGYPIGEWLDVHNIT